MPYLYIVLVVLYLFGLFFVAALAGTIMSRIAELRALILNAGTLVYEAERHFKEVEAAIQRNAQAEAAEHFDPVPSKKDRLLQ